MTFNDKRILITGGTGTFGQRCVRILLNEYKPERLIVFSRDEAKQFQMQKILPDTPPLRYFVGDIRDKDRLKRAFRGVNIVIHSAAMKQIPACEYNPFEAVKTNVIGAQNIIDAAIEEKVWKVIALSSDKAADPINLYGATKLVMEKLFIASNTFSSPSQGPHFSVVRYGNVIGSRCSVLLTFREQKEKKLPLKLTDRKMTRFWITTEQAVRFVLQCVLEMRGGEIFVPQMPSASVSSLAEIIAEKDSIEEIGARPGEKIHESLVSSQECERAYKVNNHYVILPNNRFFERSYPCLLDESGTTIGMPYNSFTNPWKMGNKDFKILIENADKEETK